MYLLGDLSMKILGEVTPKFSVFAVLLSIRCQISMCILEQFVVVGRTDKCFCLVGFVLNKDYKY